MIHAVAWMALAFAAVDGTTPTSAVAVVLSWQATSVPASRRERVEREVTEIWERLGVDIQWRAARPGELAVTIIVKDSGAAAGPFPPLGWVNFVGDRPTAVLYASADAAWNAVQAGRSDTRRFADEPFELQQMLAARLIGRAIAHELGHYLLGTRGHSAHGLMRASLDVLDTLMRGAKWYDLDAAQRATLHQRMALLTLQAAATRPEQAGSPPGG